MTRYARAKGSKASNVRAPNDATPWHVMKEQLDENQVKNQKPIEKVKTARELLKEKEDVTGSQNNWVEFEEVKAQKGKKKVKKQETDLSKQEKPKKGKILQNKKSKNAEITEGNKQNVKSDENEQGVIQKKKLKRKKNKDSTSKPVKRNNTGENPNEENTPTPNKKRKQAEENNEGDTSSKQETLTKRQKRNLKKKSKNPDTNENPSEEHVKNDKNEPRKPFPQKFNKDFTNRQNGFNNDYNNYPPKKIPKNNHIKPGKVRDDKEHARRKPDSGPTKLIINGMEVELVKYDGFPVKKEDAERLKDLRKQMVMKGIPKKDIDAAMKLERRRAEKVLARIRREVCYHCRKAGHILSDCPELGVEQASTGICFKCGSTEHTHFECKVARATEYRFASCFICREQGHIAKQCPDNPKGIYPQGGACKVCGDVTHLKKDCPDLIKEKEETTLTVDTITGDTLESLDNEKKKSDGAEDKSKKKKVVKF